MHSSFCQQSVTNSLDAAGSDSLLITVANVAPSLPALQDGDIATAEIPTITAAFTDPGLLDTHRVTIAWQAEQMQVLALDAGVLEFTGSHAYLSAGTSKPQRVFLRLTSAQPQCTLAQVLCHECGQAGRHTRFSSNRI